MAANFIIQLFLKQIGKKLGKSVFSDEANAPKATIEKMAEDFDQTYRPLCRSFQFMK